MPFAARGARAVVNEGAAKMKICILGAGSLGSTIGGVLSEGGCDVCLVDSWEEHVDAMNQNGLLISEGETERIVEVKARSDAGGLGVMDLVIVLVKSFHTRGAVSAAGNIIGPDTLVMSLQNGLGNEEAIADIVGAGRVISGKTYIGGGILGPGRVKSGVRGKATVIGEMDGQTTARIKGVAEAFNRAGMKTEISGNIVGMIWDKLLVNVSTAAITSVTKLTYGELYQLKEAAETAQEAVAEAISVAAAHGVKLDTEDPAEVWRRASAGLPADFKTSMLLGLERGIKSEIDYINGAVVRYGARVNIPTPVNRTLVACVKGIERSMGLS